MREERWFEGYTGNRGDAGPGVAGSVTVTVFSRVILRLTACVRVCVNRRGESVLFRDAAEVSECPAEPEKTLLLLLLKFDFLTSS